MTFFDIKSSSVVFNHGENAKTKKSCPSKYSSSVFLYYSRRKTLTFHFFSTTKDRIEHTERLPISTPVWCRMNRWKIFLHWMLFEMKALSATLDLIVVLVSFLRVWHWACWCSILSPGNTVNFLREFSNENYEQKFFSFVVLCRSKSFASDSAYLIQWNADDVTREMSNFNV